MTTQWSLPMRRLRLEPLSLEHRDRAVVEKRSGNGAARHFLRITFHRTAAQTRDFLQRSFERGFRDALAPAGLVHEEARDSPVRKTSEAIGVGALALDAREFVRRAELTPTDALASVEDECGMGGAFADTTLLLATVLSRVLPRPTPSG